VPLATLKTAGFKWSILGGKRKFCKKKSEGSSATDGVVHCWPHILSNEELTPKG